MEYPLTLTFILSKVAFILSIAHDDNVLGLGSTFLLVGFDTALVFVLNEFIIYSFHIDKVLATSNKL